MEVDDDHLEDFLRGVGDWDDTWDDAERARQFERYRERSIHVHCWDQREFFDVLEFTVSGMDLRWELLDAVFVEDVDDQYEFGYILRKPTAPLDAATCIERMHAVWQTLAELAVDRNERIAELRAAAAAGAAPGPDGAPPAGWSALHRLRRSRLAPALRAARDGGRKLRDKAPRGGS